MVAGVFAVQVRDAVRETYAQLPRFARTLIVLLVLAAVLLVPAVLLSRSSGQEAELAGRKLGEMQAIEGEYAALRERVDRIEKREKLVQVDGSVQAVESVLAPLGLQTKVTSARSLGVREFRDGLSEERAEIIVEKLTMNEVVNVLYRLEEAPMMLTVKKAEMKKPFESPELLNLTLTVSLFTRK